jgi:hypothetical protein
MSELKIKVINNCVSQQFIDFISEQLNAERTVWSYKKNITYEGKENFSPAFTNGSYKDGEIENTAYWFLYPLLLEVANKNNFFVERLLRIRTTALLNKNTLKYNDIHTDSNEPHIVGLYYPHDSDGDTVFFDSKENAKEIFRVSPSRGTMVLFDGSINHASSNPVNHDIRMVVNFGFVGKWPNE